VGFEKEHFSVRHIQQIILEDGYEIIITTDVPCHLWMRWSTQEPRIHIVPILRRGIEMHGNTYFCFTVFKDNEQEEVGDTIIHTFIKLNWPECETRYFYFTGKIDNIDVPSTTAIFSKHFTKPMICKCFTPVMDGEGGWLEKSAATWAEAWGSATGLPYESTAVIYAWARVASGPIYTCRRCALRWDTTSIPSGATIHCAHIIIFLTAYWVRGIQYLELVGGEGLGGEMNVADYGALRINDTPCAPRVAGADLLLTPRHDFALNPLGLTQIKPAGVSVLGLRIGIDVYNISPIDGANEAQLSFGGATDKKMNPLLVVCYTE